MPDLSNMSAAHKNPRGAFVEAYKEYGVHENKYGWDGNNLPRSPMRATNHNLEVCGNSGFSHENEFGTESSATSTLPDSFEAGLTELETGMKVQAVVAGGDWEQPVQYFVFLDADGGLQAYAPTAGNAFNPKTGRAFGNNLEKDKEWAKEQTFKWQGTFNIHKLFFTPFTDFDKMQQEFLQWYNERY